MSNSELITQAGLSSVFINAALVRSVFDDEIYIGRTTYSFGGAVITRKYFADFKDKANLEFFDRAFIPGMKKLVQAADAKGLTREIRQIFGPQALYAVQLGTVSSFSFNEITNILFPQSKVMETTPVESVVIAFPSLKRG